MEKAPAVTIFSHCLSPCPVSAVPLLSPRLVPPACLVLALLLGGCSSLSRSPRKAESPWWDAHMPADADTVALTSQVPPPEPLKPEPLKADTLEPAAADSLAPADAAKPSTPAARPTQEMPAITPEQWAARREAYSRRSEDDRQRVRQVNEYAYWCLEQGLWDEARIHLQQAVARDSLSASLHNNLGIIHERLGQHDRARQHYRMAAELNPSRDLYGVNLQRLRASLEQPRPARRDSLGDDELLMPPPRGDRRPDMGMAPAPASGAQGWAIEGGASGES